MFYIYFFFISAIAILFFGLYLIIANAFNFPKINTDIALQTLAKRQQKTDRKEVILYAMARKLAKIIKVNPYKKKLMELSLRESNIPLSPEAYVAKSILVSSIFLLLIIPFLYIMPILSVAFFIIAIWFYFKQMNELNKVVSDKRENIEKELPRFVATLAQQLKYTKNIIEIFENYKKYTEGDFLNEIDITLADMKTGQLETALIRLEARINSSMLSEVVRGLVGVVRGDDNVVYFELLSHNFKLQEVQKLKSIAVKRPMKMRKYSFAIMIVVVITYLVIMFIQLTNDLSLLF